MTAFHAGQLLCGGFQGTTVTPQAYQLIVEHRVSSMILSRKNAVNVEQMTKLINDLQYIAYAQGNYKYPIMFAIDEEGGLMNSLMDVENLSQCPSAMALAATGDSNLVYEVSKALAIEIRKIGFSIILGPVLDVVTKFSSQLLGVRSFGTTIEDVTKYGLMCAKGLKDGGLYTVGKHFPGMGNANVNSLLELPMINETLSQLENFNVLPFKTLIEKNVLDGISATGCGVPNISPDDTHACLSPIILTQLLRSKLNFQGFVISECLEMEALHHSIGLGQGVILAINAGCDFIMVCHDLNLQTEALDAINQGLKNGNLEEEVLMKSYRRIEFLQSKLPTWEEIFPNGESSAKEPIKLFKNEYPEAWSNHEALSKLAYAKSITLIRDYDDVLPISKHLTSNFNQPPDSILLLTPLLNPIYPSQPKDETTKLYSGEEVFQYFGDLLSNYNNGKNYNVLHTTYTANGLTQLHESLISKSKLVIILSSEASRNMYQIGIVKYVSVLCGNKKPLIIVATSSPLDFVHTKSLGSSYLCCYDYTNNAMEALVDVLMGKIKPQGCMSGEQKFKLDDNNSQIKRKWLVEEFNIGRDWQSFAKLWKSNVNNCTVQYLKRLNGLLVSSKSKQRHFVVRNSSLNILYGVILTWINDFEMGGKKYGHIVYVLVDKSKQLQNIGKNLYNRAIRYLIKEQKCSDIKIGSSFPLILLDEVMNMEYLNNIGWDIQHKTTKAIMILNNLNEWSVPKKILKELMIVGIRFDICNDSDKIHSLIERSDLSHDENVINIYNESIKRFKVNSPYEVKIIIALEPSSKNIIGSIIIFTNKSELSKFFPFIDDASDEPDSLTGGIIGPIIDPTYSNLAEIFKYGLISSAITFLKTNEDMKQCMMFDVRQEKQEEIGKMGFELYRTYNDYDDVKNYKQLNNI